MIGQLGWANSIALQKVWRVFSQKVKVIAKERNNRAKLIERFGK